MIKVLKIVPGDFTKESRDLREILALINNKYHVEVFAWLSNEIKKTEDRGFPVHRFQIGYQNDISAVKKLLCYMKFGWKCLKEAKEYSPDIISAHDLAALAIAMRIRHKLRRSVKVIYDSHELTSEMASNQHLPRFIVDGKRLLEKYLIKRVDAVMVVSNSIAKYNYEKYKLKRVPYVIRNIPERGNVAEKSTYFRTFYKIRPDQTILLYQGAIRAGRGIHKILEAMSMLDENIVLILMGYGDLKSVGEQITDMQLGNRVFLHDAVPYHDLIKYSSGADIGISLIENYCLSYYYCLPNKLFEYIQAGIPVLCSDFPDMSSIVKKYEIGETADPEDKEDIVNKILLIVKKLKSGEYKGPLKKAGTELCWETEQLKLLVMYSDILEKRV